MILITGATSGIGEACAREFAARGRRLVLTGRRKDRLERLRKELSTSVEVHAFELDVRQGSRISALFQSEPELFSQVSVLINNAGLAKGLDPVQTGDVADWDAMIDTNLKGLLAMSRAVLPSMIRNKRGHIVNLGSIAGQWVYPNGNVYCATKHAVHALTEALRLDLCGKGIRVTEIAPGMVETEFSQVRLGDVTRAKKVYEGMTPLSAKDVAEAIVWAVDRPPHVNIQEIVLYPTDQAGPGLVSRHAQAVLIH